jgi:hypothetical protein
VSWASLSKGALVALRHAERGDLANEVVAHKIIDLAKAGEVP